MTAEWKLKPGDVRRLVAKFAIGDGCWEWTGAQSSKGYGSIFWGGKTKKAHGVMYEIANGPVPQGLVLDHLCRVRHCVRPDHLEPVTSRENTLRGDTLAAEQAARTHCKYGHPLDIVRSGSRRCAPCTRRQQAEYQARMSPEAQERRRKQNAAHRRAQTDARLAGHPKDCPCRACRIRDTMRRADWNGRKYR